MLLTDFRVAAGSLRVGLSYVLWAGHPQGRPGFCAIRVVFGSTLKNRFNHETKRCSQGLLQVLDWGEEVAWAASCRLGDFQQLPQPGAQWVEGSENLENRRFLGSRGPPRRPRICGQMGRGVLVAGRNARWQAGSGQGVPFRTGCNSTATCPGDAGGQAFFRASSASTRSLEPLQGTLSNSSPGKHCFEQASLLLCSWMSVPSRSGRWDAALQLPGPERGHRQMQSADMLFVEYSMRLHSMPKEQL